MVLPLETKPVIGGTQDAHIIGLNEILNMVVEKPVSHGWILNDCFSTVGP